MNIVCVSKCERSVTPENEVTCLFVHVELGNTLD